MRWESPRDPHLEYMERTLFLRNGECRVAGTEVRRRAWSWRAFRRAVVEAHFWRRRVANEEDSCDGGIKNTVKVSNTL